MGNVCSPLYNAFCANNISTRRTISKVMLTARFRRLSLLLPARTMTMYEATGKNRFHKVGISDRRPTLTAQFQPQLVFIAWLVSLSSHSANNTKGRRRCPCHEISRHCRIQRKQGDSQLFHGVNVGNTTGRVYNVQTLLEMRDYGCFFQAAQQGIPETLSGLLPDLAPVISLLNKWIDLIMTLLEK